MAPWTTETSQVKILFYQSKLGEFLAFLYSSVIFDELSILLLLNIILYLIPPVYIMQVLSILVFKFIMYYMMKALY